MMLASKLFFRNKWLLIPVLIGILAVFSAFSVLAAQNTVPNTRLGETALAITANALKPSACAGLDLRGITICSGSGICRGTGNGNLILGTPGDDVIKGGNGSDCIIGGSGNDDINGQGGEDICIAGAGADTYRGCTVVQP